MTGLVDGTGGAVLGQPCHRGLRRAVVTWSARTRFTEASRLTLNNDQDKPDHGGVRPWPVRRIDQRVRALALAAAHSDAWDRPARFRAASTSRTAASRPSQPSGFGEVPGSSIL
jgi:hypothetical protein